MRNTFAFPLFSLCWLSTVAVSGYDLVVLAGQSNASGRVRTGYETNAVDPSVPYWYSTDGPAGFGVASGQWVGLGPLHTGYYGLEISMGRRLVELGLNAAILKITRGNTSLAVDWNSRSAGAAWVHWQVETRNAIEALHGQLTSVRAIVWLHGENDGLLASRANAYGTNLVALRGDMLDYLSSLQFDCTHAVFVCARVLENQPYASAVRTAQLSCDLTVDTDDLTTMEGVHYDETSVSVLGRRFADAIVAWPGCRAVQHHIYQTMESGRLVLRWASPLDHVTALQTSPNLCDWATVTESLSPASICSAVLSATDARCFFRIQSESAF